MLSDYELYGRFLAGDTTSYDELMIRYGDHLVYYINGYIHDWQSAEDLMIEAFARIMVKKPKLRTGNFKAYLFKTARNLTIRHHEKKCRVQDFSLENMIGEIPDDILTEDALQEREKEQILHMCLEKTDPQLREAIWLIYFENMSYKDAAAVMGVNIKKVDHLLERGKKKLREELTKEGVINAY